MTACGLQHLDKYLLGFCFHAPYTCFRSIHMHNLSSKSWETSTCCRCCSSAMTPLCSTLEILGHIAFTYARLFMCYMSSASRLCQMWGMVIAVQASASMAVLRSVNWEYKTLKISGGCRLDLE
jgi:hypothetical protein